MIGRYLMEHYTSQELHSDERISILMGIAHTKNLSTEQFLFLITKFLDNTGYTHHINQLMNSENFVSALILYFLDNKEKDDVSFIIDCRLEGY